MKLVLSKNFSEYCIIVGCGRLGANLANTLSDEGGNVLIIDKNKNAFRKLSPSFGGLTVTGDGTDFDVLQEAQIEKADVLVVVTNNDNVNVMIAQIAREIFKVSRVIARLYDPERECVYNEFGIDTICPAVLSAKEIDKMLSKSGNTEKADKTACELKEEIK
ncbi:potassium channel family protein [Lacrimispora saccharolytica]|uniref:TrkA-N domain protein n=1 Tax=Lacrimispora saccharolytica (strain ATCC 35040 / DSM 2544 / NRCC 2533 / WM1) TaxID=610130 RepID=D9R749_LACSW|nr:TrkA family potassium uptake protein [Lacrimispora saccharolytica]ADL05481.1 TrkA-N domain protein [[Clostridium] saccharolyticum WM1]